MITSQQRTKLQLLLAVAVLAIITLVLFNSTHSQSARAEQNTTSSASSTMDMASTTTSTTGTSTTMNMGMGTSSGTTTTVGTGGVTGSSTTATSTMSTSTPSSDTSSTSTTNMSSSTMPMTYHVMVMKHLCNNITSLADFQALESGKGPIAALANTVLNCPATGLIGNAATVGSVSSPRANYSFQVMSGTTTKTLTDGTFMAHKICESDINLDVTMDGTISSSTCLDISHYDVPLTPAGSSTQIIVTENMQPTGFHFGTIRFTPPTLSPNNDAQNLVTLDASSSTINLDMKNDTDGMIMLHVYDFRNATSSSSTTTPSTSTTTPGTGSTTPGTSGQGTTTPPSTSLQDQIDALTARVHMLETQIALLLAHHNPGDEDMNGGPTSGTTTPSSGNMMGSIDQNGTSVRSGGHIDFGGHNFGHEEHVSIMMNGSKVGDAFTNSTGSFSTGSMSAPSTLGNATYTFMGQTSGISGSATITVIP